MLKHSLSPTQSVVLDRLGGRVSAILQKSLDSAMQSYRRLRNRLIILASLRLARDRLKQQIAIADRQEEPVAIIVLGVDRYKQVTETLAHLIGDRLIQVLALRATVRLRDSDTLARISNDEFMIVASNADEEAVRILIGDILLHMSQPIVLGAAELVPRISAGVTLYPQHGTDVIELIRR